MKKIGFVDIFDVVCSTVDSMAACKNTHNVDDILLCADEARAVANSLINIRK